jgi:hypothetical protein
MFLSNDPNALPHTHATWPSGCHIIKTITHYRRNSKAIMCWKVNHILSPF